MDPMRTTCLPPREDDFHSFEVVDGWYVVEVERPADGGIRHRYCAAAADETNAVAFICRVFEAAHPDMQYAIISCGPVYQMRLNV